MGSHHNSSNSLNKSSNNKLKKNLSENYQNNQSNIYYNDSLSYKGVRTETTSININSQSGNSSTSDKVENISNDIKIPTLFQWKEGGNNIIITGSFCGWSHNFAMRKNEKTNIYELTLYLPKGEYQFKFIVDNIWRCSNFYPTVTDQNNNTNNVLNNTKELNDIIKEREKENQNTANTTPDFDKNNTKKKTNHQNASVNLSEQMKKNYTNLFPLKEQLNSEPPHLPQHYLNPLSYNSYPNIGEKEFIYNRLKNNLIRETFQSVKIPTHVYLNHILRNCKEEKKYIRSSISFRIRYKFATIIYLQPNKQELIYQNNY
jgi:hypothetical protein